ncbi:MAG: N-acetylneuraminate synthase family protein [Candidatus Omnitrophica bacterium]|nr:N-acetylneuraminate synthase family protein [Candidatus Omnitrophota bacterium]
MAKEIRIGNKFIGKQGSIFIIAEAGVNHSGNFEIAKQMVETAAHTGADAISFQHIIDSELNIKQPGPKKLEWKKWVLKKEEIKELISFAKSKKLLCGICVIDEESVDEMVDFGIDFIKIVSGDITNTPFIKYCAKTGLPLFISTGAAFLGEIEIARNAVRDEGNDKIVLYHTNTNYPTPLKEINLRVIATLQSAFDEIIGFCDHTEGYLAPLIAGVLGAKVIEKHFTLDRAKLGPDYSVSLEPDELKTMIDHLRHIEIILGSTVKEPLATEQNTLKFARRSIVAGKRIPKNSCITKDMLSFKRPGIGLNPGYTDFIIGRKAKRDIIPDEIIRLDMVI